MGVPGPGARLRFDDFELDPASGELFRAGERVPLQPQPARLLALLLERPGQVVGREDLKDALWGESVHVDVEQGLAFAVKQLRRALGDTATEPRLVETLPRRGYRLLVSVQPVDGPGPAKAQAAPRPSSRPWGRWLWAVGLVGLIAAGVAGLVVLRPSAPVPPRLAVLPFVTFGAESSLEPLAAGLTEELITEITRRYGDRLGVIARTSVMPYLGSSKNAATIARELGVAFLLEGSVRRQGEQLRVSAQLIRADDEVHLWAASLDGTGLDLMAWEQRVAREVAAALAPRFRPVAPEGGGAATELPADAHHTYLESLYLLARPGTEAAEQARTRLEAVVRQHPTFAPGFVGLAEAHMRRWASGREILAAAGAAAQRALELDPNLPEAHLVAGKLAFRFAFDATVAEAELAQALAGNPGLAQAHHEQACLWAAQGRFDEAIAALERARALDPRSLWVASDRGYFFYLARRYEDSMAASRQALELDPDFHWAHHFLLLAALAQGDRTAALAAARAEVLSREGTNAGISSLDAYWHHQLGVLERGGSELGAPSALLIRPLLALGEQSRALDLLEQAVQTRTGWYLPYLGVEPFFDPLRGEERFHRVLAELGYHRAHGQSR